jgi:hypothetical protein
MESGLAQYHKLPQSTSNQLPIMRVLTKNNFNSK